MNPRRLKIIVILAIMLLASILVSSPSYGDSKSGVIALNTAFGSDPATTRVVDWQTSSAGANLLQYETGNENGAFNASNAVTVTASQSTFATDDGVRYVHKINLNGLQPGTSYLYRVSDGSGRCSGIYHFLTEASNTDQFSFLTFSDTQATTQKQFADYFANSLSTALKSFPDTSFVLHTGDIVDNGSSEKTQWNYFFGALADTLPNLAFEPVSGNHDGESGGTANFLNHFNLPETNYSFIYGNCLFLVLDTNSGIQDQITWLENTVKANSSVKWKIVALHKGPYGGIHANDTDVAALRQELPPVFDECGIDLVLEGHDHAYMRSYFISNGQVVDNAGVNGVYENPKGITYIVTGACGAKTYPVFLKYWTGKTWVPPQSEIDNPNDKLFDQIYVTSDYLEINVLTTDLQKVDYLKIIKNND